jgi:Zn-dependent M28 family amino/carboxypeptidase
LQQAGFEVQERVEPFDTGIDIINLIAAPLPDRPELPLVIVGAHYDSIPTSPGADDNASAVAALLELARWLQPRLARPSTELRARIQLVAYDLEEFGLIGSLAHARALKRTNAVVRGMISLEMLGYCDPRPGSQNLPPPLAGLYPDTGNFIGVVANDRSLPLLAQVVRAMQTVPGLPVESMAVTDNGEALPQTRLSDHSSFWDEAYPALMITDTSFFRNPHYHQPTDTPATLDYTFLARVTEGVCSAAWNLLTELGSARA